MEKIPPNEIKVLAVDDNDEMLFSLESVLSHHGYAVFTATNGEEALAAAQRTIPDIIISDVAMPKMDGYQLVQRVKADQTLRYVPLILLSSRDGLHDVLRGLECGADDYLFKPFQPEELLARLGAALRTRALYRDLERTTALNKELQGRVAERSALDAIVGQSPAMQAVFQLIERVKDTDVPVLITGESGTGKELVASALHYNSRRREHPFVVQNCSAFSAHLLESELFGHKRGAFTGAHRDKEGLFRVADGGSFFLDELGEMEPGLQAKLLRVLQEGTFMPVGATSEVKVNVRVIGATNRDLGKMVGEGKFREDLFYRLNVVNIKLPPLRERKEDIPLMVERFLSELGPKYRKENEGRGLVIEEEAMAELCRYRWPGNVRQLRNEVERMLLLSGDRMKLGSEFLSDEVQAGKFDASFSLSSSRTRTRTLKEVLAEVEHRMIEETLKDCGGNKSEAARTLDISRSSLIAKVKQYGVEDPSEES